MKNLGLSAVGQRTQDPPIAWLMNMTLGRPDLISLAAGFTDNASLPVAETRALVGRILRGSRDGRPALQYGTTPGDAVLRRLAAERVARLDARALAPGGAIPSPAGPTVDALAGRLFITSGSQQLLSLLSEVLCDPGDIVLVEDPTYFVYLGIVQSHGLRCRGVPLTDRGLDLEHLERTLETLRRSGELSRVKLLYLVSYFQNPTGVTSDYDRKWDALRLLRRYERAAGHPLYLVEDAAYRELRFAGEDVPSLLAAPGSADRVIYGGTFSKPFATGVRVGFGVLPEALRRVVLRVKANHDFGTSNLLQRLLREALASGAYDRHLPFIRRRYRRKARLMVESMKAHFPAAACWAQPRGGLYVWTRLPRTITSGLRSRLFRSALDHDVLYVPGQLCYAHDATRPRPNHEMRLSFGGAREPDIQEGIRRLGATLRRLI